MTRPTHRPAVRLVVQSATQTHIEEMVDLVGPPKAARKAQLTAMGVTLKDLLADHAPVAVVPE
jgi:hypothetical protein